MPAAAKRRRVSGPSTKAQSTLTFQSKKPTRASAAKDEKAANAKAVDVGDVDKVVELPKPEEAEEEQPEQKILEPETTTAEAAEAEAAEGEEEVDEEEREQLELERTARALSETKIKSYWAAKERERKAPRVHQAGLSVREKILREFDMSSRFGPCIGIERLARWRRAQSLGMNPPIEILAVLLKEADDASKAKGGAKRDFQRSVIDELTLSSRLKGDGLET